MNALTNIVNSNQIFYPKALIQRTDLREDTKLLFAELLTDYSFLNISQFRKMLKDLNINYIKINCHCSNAVAFVIKKQIATLADELDSILGAEA